MKPPALSRRDFLRVGTAVAALPAGIMRAAEPASSSIASPVQSSKPLLSTRGLFMHVWDLRDQGVDSLLGWMRGSDLSRMYIAGTYHSGWFVHPHSPSRLWMTEGGVAYFQPDEKLYARTKIRPQVAGFVKETNWLARAGERLDHYGLRMVSWTIGAHNTKLGLLHSECTQHDAYGDSIPHALSIGHDETREYLKALCRDLATNYPMYGIQLESFGWMEVRHGHHHERDLTGLTPLEQELLSICFNPQTVKKAQVDGVDAEKAREAVRAVLDGAFREAPDRPKGHPQTMAELEDRSADLKAYNRFRRKLADSLIVEIKEQALKGTSCKLLLQGGYRKEVAGVADGFASGAYGQPPEKVLEIVRKGKSAIPHDWNGEFPCFIRLGMGVPASAQQLREIVLALKEGGSTGPIFYNYSESPLKMLGWIKGAISGL